MNKFKKLIDWNSYDRSQKIFIGSLVGLGIGWGVYQVLSSSSEDSDGPKSKKSSSKEEGNAPKGLLKRETVLEILQQFKERLAPYIDDVETLARATKTKSSNMMSDQQIQDWILKSPQIISKKERIENDVLDKFGVSRKDFYQSLATEFKTDQQVQQQYSYLQDSINVASLGQPVDLIGNLKDYCSQFNDERILKIYRRICYETCIQVQNKNREAISGQGLASSIFEIEQLRELILSQEGITNFPDPPNRIFNRLMNHYEKNDTNGFRAKQSDLSFKRMKVMEQINIDPLQDINFVEEFQYIL